MPSAIILVVISGFVGGVFASVLSELVFDCINLTDCYLKRQIEQNMMVNDPIELKDNEIIPNEALINKIVDNIKGDCFGVSVLAAPTGSGKTTAIKMAMKLIKLRDPNIKLKLIKNGISALSSQNIHEYLKIPPYRAFSEYLSKNSVIIIDQIDFKTSINDNLCCYLTGLAADSANSKKYKIILCVSDANVAKQITFCNNMEKFYYVFSYKSLMWSENQINDLINLKLSNLSQIQRNEVHKLALEGGGSPGLIAIANSKLKDNKISLDGMKYLVTYSNRSKASWEMFTQCSYKYILENGTY